MQRNSELLQVGIGINTGLVEASNMALNSRINYSVIGDNVNLASRLEALTRYYWVPILVSDQTRALAPEFSYGEIDWLQIKGRQQAVCIYEPFAKGVSHHLLQQHQQALYLYRNQSFKDVLA